MSAFEQLQQCLKGLPGLGYRSAERLALHLLVEHPESCAELMEALKQARATVHACPGCGNLCEGQLCSICTDRARDDQLLCIVETVPDLRSMERSGAFRGRYHVLHGKLSPIHGVGPEELNMESLKKRLAEGDYREIILALSNDIEGQATCHYLQEEIISGTGAAVSRIGFGLPSGGGIPYADPTTLRSALEGRRRFE
ncbi:MAG: recombination mediator RecR [Oceanipulchritudo sp.]|jgi:recombination protein RecR